jgi:hypothetical protein
MNEEYGQAVIAAQHKEDDDHIRYIPIHIDGKPYKATKPRMTGAEIKVLGHVPADYQLFLEVPGPGADRGIRDDEVVEMKPGQRFHSVPAGTLGSKL